MRVVLDTNILARAAKGPPGLADALLMQAVSPPHVLCVSTFLLCELARVLRYPRVRTMHGMTDGEIDAYVRDIQMASLVVDVPPIGVDVVVPSDPQDDPVVATTVLAQAQVLSTLDRHLLHPSVISYCTDRGIRVASDLELLGILRSHSA